MHLLVDAVLEDDQLEPDKAGRDDERNAGDADERELPREDQGDDHAWSESMVSESEEGVCKNVKKEID